MKTIELSLKEFLVAILHSWWIILICIVLGAGSFAIRSLSGETDAQISYQEKLATYEEQQKAREIKLGQIDTDIANAEYVAAPYTTMRNQAYTYMWESPLMRINPFDVSKAYSNILIEVEASANNGNLKNISDEYVALASSLPLQNMLGDDFPTGYQEKYVRELIQIGKLNDEAFSIQCYSTGDARINAERIVVAFYNYLLGKQQQTSELLGNHTLVLLGSGVVHTIEPQLDSYMRSRVDNTARYEELVVTYSARIDNLKGQRASFLSADTKAPIDLPIVTSSVQTYITNVIPGAVIGAVLGIILVLLLYILMLPVQTFDQIMRQLGIRYLGSSNISKKVSADVEFGVLRANMHEKIGSMRRVLLTGTVQSDVLATLSEKLNFTFEPDNVHFENGSYIIENANTIRLLSDVDAVILVERLHASKVRKINREIERIKQTDKPILGYLIC